MEQLITMLIILYRNVDILLVTGSKAAYAADVEKEYQKMGKEKTSILKINDVADVVQEAVRS